MGDLCLACKCYLNGLNGCLGEQTTWVHGVNLNFDKTNSYVHCIYICFVDLRSSPLDTCVLEILCFVCAGSAWTKELLWADSTIGVWIYIHLLALLLLCSLCSEWTRKFRVHLLSSPNPEVPDFKPISFIRCVWVKICRWAYSPTL